MDNGCRKSHGLRLIPARHVILNEAERSEGSPLRDEETFFSRGRSFGCASEPALSEVEGMTESLEHEYLSESVPYVRFVCLHYGWEAASMNDASACFGDRAFPPLGPQSSTCRRTEVKRPE